MREVLGGALGLLALGGAARAQAGEQDASGGDASAADALRFPRSIVLVRHAEKAAEPAEDPRLSEAGLARAERLSKMLGAAGVTHLFASEFERTQATLAPLAQSSGRPLTKVRARDGAALVSALDSLPRGALAVVAGHSNTVPALLRQLTAGRTKLSIDESEYDRLFLVVQWGPRAGMQLALELRYA